MKRLIYQVYTGKRLKLYDHCTYSVAQYAERINADYIQQRQPILRIKPDIFTTNRNPRAWEQYGGFLPIYEKENAFDYYDRYDQIAIIDADIWIRETAPNIFEELEDYDAGFVCEREMPIVPNYAQNIAAYTEGQYGMEPYRNLFDWDKRGIANFYNMGMMLLNTNFKTYLKGKTSREFLEQPKFKKFIDGDGKWKWSTDQTLLNIWVKEEKMKIKNLNWKWNGLYSGIDNMSIKQCHFVHFFLKSKLPHQGENIEDLLKLV